MQLLLKADSLYDDYLQLQPLNRLSLIHCHHRMRLSYSDSLSNWEWHVQGFVDSPQQVHRFPSHSVPLRWLLPRTFSSFLLSIGVLLRLIQENSHRQKNALDEFYRQPPNNREFLNKWIDLFVTLSDNMIHHKVARSRTLKKGRKLIVLAGVRHAKSIKLYTYFVGVPPSPIEHHLKVKKIK